MTMLRLPIASQHFRFHYSTAVLSPGSAIHSFRLATVAHVSRDKVPKTASENTGESCLVNIGSPQQISIVEHNNFFDFC